MPASTPWTVATPRTVRPSSARPSPYARPPMAGPTPRASATSLGFNSQVRRALGITRPPSHRAAGSTMVVNHDGMVGSHARGTARQELDRVLLAARTDAPQISYTIRARPVSTVISVADRHELLDALDHDVLARSQWLLRSFTSVRTADSYGRIWCHTCS